MIALASKEGARGLGGIVTVFRSQRVPDIQQCLTLSPEVVVEVAGQGEGRHQWCWRGIHFGLDEIMRLD